MAKEKKKNIKHKTFPSCAHKEAQERPAVCGMSFEKNEIFFQKYFVVQPIKLGDSRSMLSPT